MKNQRLARLILAILGSCMLSLTAYADQCALTYPDGLTNSSNSGSIKFTNTGRLINNPDTILATTSVFNNGFANTCTSADCSASGSIVPALTGSFSYYTSSSNLSVNGYSTTISYNDYKDITVKGYGSLTMSSNFSTYTFRKLKVENHSTVNFRPGDYYIEDLEIKGGSVLNVIGTGTVRIYARTKAKFKESSVINGGSSGDASQLFLYYFATGDDKIKVESGAKVTAFMYSVSKVEIKGISDVYGGISAAGDIHIKNDSWVTYQNTAVANTDFGDACSSGAVVIDHYQITHDNSGSTCSAESVTIKACLNSACTSLSTDEISLDFQADGVTKSSPTFTGSTVLNFNHTTAEVLTLSVANTSVNSTNALECSDGSGSSCDITFTSSGCSSGNTCANTFTDALTNSNDNGSIKFEQWGRVTNNPDTVLATTSVIHNNSYFTTCSTANCTAGGTSVPPLSATFVANASSNNLTVNGISTTITNNDYQDVSVKNGGFLTMNSSYNSYRFKKLTVEFLSSVILTAGDYYIDELEVKGGSTLVVTGSGTVRLFVKNKATFKELSRVNGGLFGDASKLFLYYFAGVDDSVRVESTASFAGFIYSENRVELRDFSFVYGGISAAGEINVKDLSSVTYRGSAIEDTDFGSACSSSGSDVHHYQFEYNGGALTCQTQTINIKACANADCSALYASPSSLTLVASTPTPDSVNINLAFTGSTSINLAESLPTTVSLGMSAANPSSDLQCYENNGLDVNCNYTLADTGFIFLNETDNNQTIPMQISGKPSDTGYNSKTLVLQAVQTDLNTGACAALFPNNTDVSIDLAYQCEDPGTCSGSANAAKLTNNGNTFNLTEYGSYGSHNLRFAADSKATIVLNYPDAGKIKLHARKAIVLSQNETTMMTGSSQSIVVRPFGFHMNIGANPGASDNSGSVFMRAGQKFDVTLSAVQWQASEDDGQGNPINGADLSDNGVTPNFGQELDKETATITTQLVSPAPDAGNHNPTLGNNQFNVFVSGSQAKTGNDGVSWGDVGVVSFNAAGDGEYLDSRENVTSVIPHVGRFVPNHFRLVNSSLIAACGDFSYMGQSLNMGFELRAQGVGDIPLLNYDGGVGNHGLATVALVAENNNAGNNLGSRFANVALDWVDGAIIQAVSTNFARLPIAGGMDGPYDNLFTGLQLSDGDAHAVIGFSGATPNMNADNTGNCVDNSNCNAITLHANEAKFRYGRLRSSAAFGPATTSITAPIQTEYWDSKSFVLSLTDSCSTLQANEIDMSGTASNPFAATYNVKDLTSHATTGTVSVDVSPPSNTVNQLSAADGYFYLTLTAPAFSVGNTGYVPVTIDATAYPWLQYDWDTYGQGAVDAFLPTQNVTFGQFRGNDRVIYWREKL